MSDIIDQANEASELILRSQLSVVAKIQKPTVSAATAASLLPLTKMHEQSQQVVTLKHQRIAVLIAEMTTSTN